ncbi:E3 ubiquitin-protein ligase RNF4-like isoform X1 [Iris pallida]|uniref:E3 ubiquitin-protein ligase RNF4-like isoform X1 n=1 Tax=Iris pallida TaxID=29817 RepID=A0AAX6HPE4_IRIPA|nr:E3 ubiquitin-protein ligase RNF4-like isoform X1 [Iris pallida]KAJ6853136.1 E3 ubiquitin-protein ligase RNF4-like isoform X1 [Iris pallida]
MSGNSIDSSSQRRYSRRNSARDPSTGRKPALDVDLNCLPPRTAAAAEGLLSLSDPAIGVGTATAPIGGDAAVTPIDLESIDDDDVQMLSSPRGFPQTRNQPRRNRPVIVVVDEEREHSQRSVMLPCLIHTLKRPRIQPKRTIINCESYSTSEDNVASIPAPQKVVPKEPTFSCPICMTTLDNPCSTVCGHIFCESCLKAAIQVQKKCPTCRAKLTNKSFHRVFLPTTTAD